MSLKRFELHGGTYPVTKANMAFLWQKKSKNYEVSDLQGNISNDQFAYNSQICFGFQPFDVLPLEWISQKVIELTDGLKFSVADVLVCEILIIQSSEITLNEAGLCGYKFLVMKL